MIGMATMGNVLPRFILAAAVAAFYTFYVVQALRTGRARKFLGGWVTAREAPGSYYAVIGISGCLAIFAVYIAVRSGAVVFAR